MDIPTIPSAPIILAHLARLTAERISEIAEALKEITNLWKELELLKGFLGDARDRQEDDLLVRKWLTDIKTLHYEAQQLTNKHLPWILRNIQYQDSLLWYRITRSPRAILDALVIGKEASEIQFLTQKISLMTSEMEAYGIESTTVSDSATTDVTTSSPRGPCADGEGMVVIGRDEDIKAIEKQLVEGNGSNIVGICGANGLGKTTLAREIVKRDMVKLRFDHAIVWVFLGTDFRLTDVVKKILVNLLKDADEEERDAIAHLEVDVLIELISQILRDNRCLVVLDDFQNNQTWDCLRHVFTSVRGSDSLSKLVLTTCDAPVLTYVDCRGFIHQPRFLNFEERCQLLNHTALPGKGITGRMRKVTEKPIMKNCTGLPLTIYILGGIIKRDFSLYPSPRFSVTIFKGRFVRTDTKVCLDFFFQDFQREDMGDQSTVELEVNAVLKLSDASLKSTLRLCLREILNYPEGFEIPADDLFQVWINKGIISTQRAAQKRLDKLVERSLIQVVEMNESTGKIKSCQVHSVVRDFYCNLPEESSNCCIRWNASLKHALFPNQTRSSIRL